MTFIVILSIWIGKTIDHLDVRAKPSRFMTAVIAAITGFNGFVKGATSPPSR